MSVVERRCPVCGNKYYEILAEHKLNLPELLKFMPDNLYIVSCKNCGMIYTLSCATQNTYNQYYDTIHAYTENKNTHDEREDYYSEKIWEKEYDIIKEYVKRDVRIIDIGTGTGGMLKIFQKHGFENLIGIDIDDKKELMQSKGFRFLQGDINSLPALDISDVHETYNLYILNGVLEHIFDVRTAMYSLLDTMKTQDYLFIMVPDADEYITHFDKAFRYFGMEHINHFNQRTLRILFENYGFEIVDEHKFDYALSDGNTDPAISVLVQKKKMSKDVIGRERIIAYIEKSKKDDIEVIEKIHDLLYSHKNLIVWGCGSYFMSLCEKTELLECNIKFLVDNNKSLQGTKIGNLDIKPPKEIYNYPNCCICIISAAYASGIMDEIKKMEIKNEIVII